MIGLAGVQRLHCGRGGAYHRGRMTRPGLRAWIVGLIGFGALRCGGDDGPSLGQETAGCADGVCFPGLMCRSDLCVAPEGASTTEPTTEPTTAEPTTGEPEGTVGPGLPCNPYLQDCIAGYKCYPQDNMTDVCVKLADAPAEVGEPCTPNQTSGLDNDTCVEGAFCDDITTGEYQCISMCKAPVDDPSCPPDTICHAWKGGTAPVCRPRCDPLNVTCRTNQLCIPSALENGFFCFSPYNQFDYGQVCYSAINSCQRGLMCVPDEAFPDGGCIGGDYGCCSYVCDLDAPACPGQVPNCVPWWPLDSTPAGDENIGYCSI